MKAAQAILKKARKHVAKYGLDGGWYPSTLDDIEERMCPRALVAVYANEVGRNAFVVPNKPSARKALEALDQASGLESDEGKRHWYEEEEDEGYELGRRAESHAWALAFKGESSLEEQLAYIDEAIALA